MVSRTYAADLAWFHSHTSPPSQSNLQNIVQVTLSVPGVAVCDLSALGFICKGEPARATPGVNFSRQSVRYGALALGLRRRTATPRTSWLATELRCPSASHSVPSDPQAPPQRANETSGAPTLSLTLRLPLIGFTIKTTPIPKAPCGAGNESQQQQDPATPRRLPEAT